MIARTGQFELNNPLPGVPAQIVGVAADRSICEYTRGGTVSYRTDVGVANSNFWVNDHGDIAGNVSITVQVRKNRPETTEVIYRDTGVVEYLEGNQVQGLTNDGTVLIYEDHGVRLYIDGWGFVDVDLLIAPGSAIGSWGVAKINNAGLPAFGQIAGITGFAELQILTPVAITP